MGVIDVCDVSSANATSWSPLISATTCNTSDSRYRFLDFSVVFVTLSVLLCPTDAVSLPSMIIRDSTMMQVN